MTFGIGTALTRDQFHCTILIITTGGVLAKKFEQFDTIRENCRKRTTKQAERMFHRNSKKGKIEVVLGTSVRIPVPLVDQAKCDQCNILGVVMEKIGGNFFHLETKFGVLEGGYTLNRVLISF